jgi:peptidoglycan hydrolase-like protein with peptidoglycan-binding domain
MDLKSLMTKLDQLNEAPGDQTSRADYDKFKAEDAKKAAIEQVKKLASIPLNQIPRLGDAIDPKTGIIYYGEAGLDSNLGSPRKYPYEWFTRTGKTEANQLKDLLTTAGLTIVPHQEKTLFGTAEYAKVEPEKLANIDKLNQPSPCADKLAKLRELINKVKELRGSQTGATTQSVPTPNVQVREGMISETIVNEFIYNYNDQLNEWSTQDTLDTARAAYQGLTLGAGDNITAGVKSALGPDTYAQALQKEKEKTAAAKERSPSIKFTDPVFKKEWNPSAYDAAELVGAVALPIPGVGLAGQAAARGTKAALKSAPTAAKIAAPVARATTTVGATYGAMAGAESLLKGHNLATQIKATGGDLRVALAQDAFGFTGKELDGKMGPMTADAIRGFQQGEGLPVTGKLDPATLTALGIK